jgi:hypothetical protein
VRIRLEDVRYFTDPPHISTTVRLDPDKKILRTPKPLSINSHFIHHGNKNKQFEKMEVRAHSKLFHLHTAFVQPCMINSLSFVWTGKATNLYRNRACPQE